eukprot:TRINITY_DN811_c0_g1_i6.p1 TRINITY_DN811_c0_g1~~TRINITY_DN811_c0_g1_i6.p1  ORF type:complete len:2794 (+),score=860.52 TRINITY_DN811_c0_g1_i6:1298-9679(+)
MMELQDRNASLLSKLDSATSVEELQTKLSTVEELNTNLTNENEELKTQLEAARTTDEDSWGAAEDNTSAKVAELEDQLNNTKKELTEAKAAADSLQEQISKQKSEIDVLQTSSSEQSAVVQTLTSEIEKKSSTEESLQQQLTSATDEITVLKEKLEEANAKIAATPDEDSWGAAEDADNTQKVIELEEQLKNAKKELTQSQTEMMELQDRNASLLSKLDSATSVEELQTKLSTVEELNTNLTNENEELKTQLEAARAADEDSWGAAEEKANATPQNGDITALEEEIAKITSDRDKAMSDLTTMQSEMTELKEQNTALVNEKESLSNQLNQPKDGDNWDDVAKEATAEEVTTLREEVDRLNALIAETQEYISDLQGQLSVAEEHSIESKDHIKDLEDQLQKQSDENNNLKNETADLTKTISELSQNGTDADLVSERDKLKELCGKLKEGGKKMMSERNNARTRATELEQQLKVQSSKNEELTAQVAELENKITEQQVESEPKDEWGDSWEEDKTCAECESNRSKVTDLEKVVSSGKAEIAELQQQVEASKNCSKCEQLATEVADLNQQLSNSNNKEDEWGDSWEESKTCSECDKLNELIGTLRYEIENLQQEIRVSHPPSPSSGEAVDPNIALVLAQLGTEVEEKDRKIRVLSEKISFVEERNIELEKQSHDLQTKFDSAQAEIAVIENAKRVVIEDLLAFKQQQRHHPDFEGKVDTSNGLSGSDMQELQSKLVELADERDEWRGKCRDHEIEINRLKESLSTQKSLSAPVDDPFSRPSDAVASLREQVADWRDKYEEVSCRCAVLDKQNGVLQQKISSQNKAIDDIEIIENEAEEFRADLAASEARVKILEDRIAELEAIEKDLTDQNLSSKNSVTEITQQLALSTAKIAELEQSKQKILEELSVFEQQCSTLKNEVSSLRGQKEDGKPKADSNDGDGGWEVDSFELASDDEQKSNPPSPIAATADDPAPGMLELTAAREEIASLKEEIVRLQESCSPSHLNGGDANTSTDWSSNDEEGLVQDSVLENEVSLLKKELANAQAMAESHLEVCQTLEEELQDEPVLSRNLITEEWLNAASEDISQKETASQWSGMNDLYNVMELELLDAEIDKLKSQNETVAAEQRHMESATNEILQKHEQELSIMEVDRSSFVEQISGNDAASLQMKLIEAKSEIQQVSRIANIGLRNAHYQIASLTKAVAEETTSRESAQNAAVEAAGVTSEYEHQITTLQEKLNEAQAAAHRWQSTADSQAEKFGKLQQMLQSPASSDMETQLRTQLVELEGKLSSLETTLEAKQSELIKLTEELRVSVDQQHQLQEKVNAQDTSKPDPQLDQQLIEYQTQLHDKNQHIALIEDDRNTLQKTVDSLQQELSSKDDELTATIDKLSTTTTALSAETAKCGKLHELLEDRESNTKEYSTLQSEVVNLEGKVSTLEAAVESKTAENASLTEQLTSTRSNEATLQHELESKSVEVTQWATYHDQEAARLNGLYEELAQKAQHLEQTNSELETRLQQEESDRTAQLADDNKTLKSEVEKLQTELTSINGKLETKTTAGDEWVSERRQLKDTIARLEDEVSQAEMKMKTLEVSKISASSPPTTTSESSLDVIQTGNLETLQKKCVSLDHKLQRSREQISEQAAQFGDQITEWQGKCSKYEGQMADLSKRCISLESDLRTSEDDRKACQQELVDYEEKNTRVSAALESVQTQLQQSKSEVQTVTLQLAETRSNYEISCAEVIRKNHEIREFDAKNDVLTEEVKQQAKKFEEEDTKHREKFESLRTHTDALKIKIAELEKEKALTTKHLAAETSQKEESKKEVLNLKIALDNATRKLGDDEADLLREKLRQSIASHDELIEQNREMMTIREQHAKEIAELTHANTVLAADTARLEGQLEVERTVGSSKMDQEATILINNLRNDLKSSKQEVTSTSKSLREAQTGLASARDELQDVMMQLTRDKRRLTDVCEERDATSHKYEELLTINTAAETQLKSLKRDILAMEQQVRDSEEAGKQIREELSNKLNTTESMCVTLRKDIASKTAAVETLSAENARLKGIIKGNDNKYTKALQQRDESSGVVRSQISKLQDSRMDDETVIARLRAELEVKDRAWNESEEHHRVRAVEYEEKLKLFDNLSKEHELLQKQQAKIITDNRQSDERVKSALEVERSSIQKLKKSEVARIELEKQLRKTQTELLSAQRRSAESSEIAEAATAQNIKLKRELEVVDDQVKEAQRRNKRLTDGMHLVSQQQGSSHHGNGNVDVGRLLNRIQHLEMELDSKKNISNGNGSAIGIKNDVQVTWFSEKLLLTAEVDNLKRKCLMLEDHIEGLQTDLRDADEVVSEAQEQAREAEERVRELEEELVTAVAEAAISRKESQQLQQHNQQQRRLSHDGTHHSRRRSVLSSSSSDSSDLTESPIKGSIQKGSNGWDELLLVEEERLIESCDTAQVAADRQLATCAKLRQSLHKLRRNAGNAVQHSASISESHRSTLENLVADCQQAGDVVQCFETSARKVQQRVNEAVQYRQAFAAHVKALRGIKSPWTNPIGKMIIQHHRGKWCGSADALVESMTRESEESERLLMSVMQWKDVPLMSAEAVEAAELAAPLIMDIGSHIEMGPHCDDIWPPALEDITNNIGIQQLTSQLTELKRDNERLRQRLSVMQTPVSQPQPNPSTNPEIEKHFEGAVLHGYHLDSKCKFLSSVKATLTSTLLVTSKPLPVVNSWTQRFRKAAHMIIAIRRLSRLRTEAKERLALVRHSPLQALQLLLKERYLLFEKLNRRGTDSGSATMILIEVCRELI